MALRKTRGLSDDAKFAEWVRVASARENRERDATLRIQGLKMTYFR
jgi:hypothetical protein